MTERYFKIFLIGIGLDLERNLNFRTIAEIDSRKYQPVVGFVIHTISVLEGEFRVAAEAPSAIDIASVASGCVSLHVDYLALCESLLRRSEAEWQSVVARRGTYGGGKARQKR